MKRIPRWLWITAVVLVGAFLAGRAAFAPRPIAVLVAAVERGPVEQLVANSEAGSVRARQMAKLACDRSGRVTAILHREGENVRAGEVLLQLDSTTAGATLHAAPRIRRGRRGPRRGAGGGTAGR